MAAGSPWRVQARPQLGRDTGAGEGCVDQGHEPVGGQVDEQVVEGVVGQAADVGGELPVAGAHATSPPAGTAAGA